MAIGCVLPAARVLVALDAVDEAAAILPSTPPSQDEGIGIGDPVGGLLAVKSRLVLHRNPTVALALAGSVLDRPTAALVWWAVRHLLDAGTTLASAEARAEEAVRPPALLEGKRLDLLLMEAGLLAGRLGIEPAAQRRAEAPGWFEIPWFSRVAHAGSVEGERSPTNPLQKRHQLPAQRGVLGLESRRERSRRKQR